MRQISCQDRRGLLSDLIIALKQMPLEVRSHMLGMWYLVMRGRRLRVLVAPPWLSE